MAYSYQKCDSFGTQQLVFWISIKLPGLNQKAYQQEITVEDFVAIAHREVLNKLPNIDESLSQTEAKSLLSALGLLGSSVERHAQQNFIRRQLTLVKLRLKQEPTAVQPGLGLKLLQVNSQSFTDYFSQLARFIGHPNRDSFASFVEFNGAAIRVRHPQTKETICLMPHLITQGKWLTFTEQQAEIDFLSLLKKSFALQKSANYFLEQIQDPNIDLASDEAISCVSNAANLMRAVAVEIAYFMANSQFDSNFFLDYLRQYACVWSQENYLKPPSGANDYASLERDLILFKELIPPIGKFPGYHRHVRSVFSVLMPHEIKKLKLAMSQDSIEAKIYHKLGLNRQQINRLSEREALHLLTENPWLAAYNQLYTAQKEQSHIHYSSIKKYLIRPKRIRDSNRDSREKVTVVSNQYGTTGMNPLGIVKIIDRARANHPLNNLTRTKNLTQESKKLAMALGITFLSRKKLSSLCSLDS